MTQDNIEISPEDSFEYENRMKNLMWTVSSDYSSHEFGDKLIGATKNISMYNAIKQGAMQSLFDRDYLALYLAKKIYLGALERDVIALASLCCEQASYKHLSELRPGTAEIRERALIDITDYEFSELSGNLAGRIRLNMIRSWLGGGIDAERNIKEASEIILALDNCRDVMEIVKATDKLYNAYFDTGFERKIGDLSFVLSVTLSELSDYDWSDFLGDEIYTDQLEAALDNINAAISNLSQSEGSEKKKSEQSVVYVDDEALAKMSSYVERNYGSSYLGKEELLRRQRALCRGMHADCSLHYTEGLLKGAPANHSQYKYAEMQASKNKMIYYDNHRLVKRNIAVLTDIIKKSLVLRSENEISASDRGVLAANRLWRIGRCRTDKLFDLETKKNELDFVVDILIDASGSQSKRQGKVAMQGYIISSALSKLGISHRVQSFCTFWDYTILHRFRDYDEDASVNFKMFEYMTSSNNRDGLAIKAACYDLSRREEANKILIILSDGRPNDVNINRPHSRVTTLYSGEEAVRDTAYEVRRARAEGISVLGVFAGEDQDLSAEKRIFGKDFAYIRNIANFSNVVGAYLKKQIDN